MYIEPEKVSAKFTTDVMSDKDSHRLEGSSRHWWNPIPSNGYSFEPPDLLVSDWLLHRGASESSRRGEALRFACSSQSLRPAAFALFPDHPGLRDRLASLRGSGVSPSV